MKRSAAKSSESPASGFLFGDVPAASTDPAPEVSGEAKKKKKRASKKTAKESEPETAPETGTVDLGFFGTQLASVSETTETPQTDSVPVESPISPAESAAPALTNDPADVSENAQTPNSSDVLPPENPAVVHEDKDMPCAPPAESSLSGDAAIESPAEAAPGSEETSELPAPVLETTTPESATVLEAPAQTSASLVASVPVRAEGSTLADKRPSAYQVVARRYRPQGFEELIGQETVARALSNAIETDRVGHAYLFTGARGVGKTSCARIFAKALNCVEGPTTHPCLHCDSCVGIAAGDDVDVLEIDGASNRGVDEIRQLRQNAAIAPSKSLYKIYIIDEVHMLTREAFNALLKTLEEPPARVKFIFCTTEPNKIPITILSRCQRFDFSSINGVSISARLAQIARQEGAEAEDGVFDVLARRANGSMRDAQSLLEQLLSFAPGYLTLEAVHNMFGSVDDGKMFELLEATAEGNAARVFETLRRASDQGVDFGALTEQTLGIFRDLMVVASGCGASELISAPVSRFPDLQRIAKSFGIRRILASLQILDQTAQRMRFSAQARILAEIAFARLCRLDAFQTIENLIAQLQSGALPNVSLNAPLPASPSDQGVSDGQKKNSAVTLRSHDVESTGSIRVEPETTPSIVSSPSARDVVMSETATLPSSNWTTLPQEKLEALWRESTDIGVVLPNSASAFSEVRADGNAFLVVFSPDRAGEKNYCESEREKIQLRLSEKTGEKVTLRLVVDPAAKSRAPSPGVSLASASGVQTPSQKAGNGARAPRGQSSRELYRKVEENETARLIRELFDAELTEVKPPEARKNNGTFGR